VSNAVFVRPSNGLTLMLAGLKLMSLILTVLVSAGVLELLLLFELELFELVDVLEPYGLLEPLFLLLLPTMAATIAATATSTTKPIIKPLLLIVYLL
jgi:hypothetical protein